MSDCIHHYIVREYSDAKLVFGICKKCKAYKFISIIKPKTKKALEEEALQKQEEIEERFRDLGCNFYGPAELCCEDREYFEDDIFFEGDLILEDNIDDGEIVWPDDEEEEEKVDNFPDNEGWTDEEVAAFYEDIKITTGGKDEPRKTRRRTANRRTMPSKA